MKATLQQLRRLIREEASFLHGVPEWKLRQLTTDYADQIRAEIKKYVLLNKSQNPSDQREAIAAMNDVCDDMEKKLYDVLEDCIFAYTRRV